MAKWVGDVEKLFLIYNYSMSYKGIFFEICGHFVERSCHAGGAEFDSLRT